MKEKWQTEVASDRAAFRIIKSLYLRFIILHLETFPNDDFHFSNYFVYYWVITFVDGQFGRNDTSKSIKPETLLASKPELLITHLSKVYHLHFALTTRFVLWLKMFVYRIEKFRIFLSQYNIVSIWAGIWRMVLLEMILPLRKWLLRIYIYFLSSISVSIGKCVRHLIHR